MGYQIIVKTESRDIETLRKKRALVVKRMRDWARKHKSAKEHKHLYSTFTSVVRRRGGRFEVVFKSSADYAQYLERGTRPHEIRAVHAKALRFKGRKGEWIFRYMVRHPGTKEYRFMEFAVRSEFLDEELVTKIL